MWFLHVFGSKVEDVMGHGRFLAFYLISGIFASMMNIYINPRSPMPVIGASGAIAGVMGAYRRFYCWYCVGVFLQAESQEI
jgi:membrane associated rhomboid family serine protease